MILLATIFRVADGMPLCSSTDFHQNSDLKLCQKYVKQLSKRLSSLPDRCVLPLTGFNVCFISTMDLTFLLVCEESYPTVLAYSYLNEVQKEFLVSFDRALISALLRPYSLIQFDVVLQKTKQRYNNPHSLKPKLNLADMSQELRLRPPYEVREEDLIQRSQESPYTRTNGTSTFKSSVEPMYQVPAVSWFGWLISALNIFCALLNLLRGMIIISHGHIDDEDRGAYRSGLAFLAAFILTLIQVYRIFVYSRWMKYHSMLLFLSLCFCHYYLQDLRNWAQIVFHMAANALATLVIVRRGPGEKLPGWNV